jgi:uncharacterized protein
MTMDEKLFGLMLRRCGVSCIFLLLLALACALFITPGFDNTLEGWIDTDSVEYRDYLHLIDTFGNDQTIYIAFQRKDVTTDKLKSYLEKMDLIQSMAGVSAVYDPLQRFFGASEFDSVDESLAVDLQQYMSTHPPDFRSVLVSQDTALLGLLVIVDREQQTLHPGILEVVEQSFLDLDIPYHIGGTVYFAEVLNRTLPIDLAIVITLLVVLALIALQYYLRNLRLVISIFTGIVLSLVFTLAFAGALGMKMTLLSLIIFPLVFCVSITTAIHLFSKTANGVWLASSAYHKVRQPAFMAMLTTAIGCASFSFAPHLVVSRMGLVLPIAVILSFLCTLFATPTIFALLDSKRVLAAGRQSGKKQGWRLQRWISWTLLTGAIFAALTVSHIKTNPDAFYFFKQDSDFVRSYEFIENQLTGLVAIEMVLQANDQSPLTQDPHRQAITEMLSHLRRLSGLTSAVSIFDSLTVMTANSLPDDIRNSMLNKQATEARVTLRFKNSADFDYRETVAQIDAIWERMQPTGITMRLTGLVPLILDAQDALLKVQSKVFFFSLGILTGLIALIFRSMRIIICAFAANFIPLLLTAGSMVALDISINSFNIFVAAVMLGVIVDDTIHLLYAYRETGKMTDALKRVKSALWMTTMTVLLAFSTLMFSEFVPVIQFGFLSTIAVGSAYLCDVFLLPYLMRGAARQYERTTE